MGTFFDLRNNPYYYMTYVILLSLKVATNGIHTKHLSYKLGIRVDKLAVIPSVLGISKSCIADMVLC